VLEIKSYTHVVAQMDSDGSNNAKTEGWIPIFPFESP